EPAGVIVLASVDRHILDALTEGPIGEDGGGIGVGERQSAVRSGAPERLDQLRRKSRRKRSGAAAIDDQSLAAVGQFEGERRGRALLGDLLRRRWAPGWCRAPTSAGSPSRAPAEAVARATRSRRSGPPAAPLHRGRKPASSTTAHLPS